MMEQTPAIEMRDVHLTLGTSRFQFNCRIQAGAITAITGPSGAGKSTFLNLVAGFETPQTGQVFIQGQDVSFTHPSQRPVSLVFQDNNLFSHLDLFTNIGLGIHPALKLNPQERSSISEALEWVGLKGMEKRKPATLSGGERQRVAFARALVRKKPLLLLDEPFGALDTELRTEMGTLLMALHRKSGNTILLVSHNPEDVNRLAEQVLEIQNGRMTRLQ